MRMPRNPLLLVFVYYKHVLSLDCISNWKNTNEMTTWQHINCDERSSVYQWRLNGCLNSLNISTLVQFGFRMFPLILLSNIPPNSWFPRVRFWKESVYTRHKVKRERQWLGLNHSKTDVIGWIISVLKDDNMTTTWHGKLFYIPATLQ